mgnify:CR=1 FL=1
MCGTYAHNHWNNISGFRDKTHHWYRTLYSISHKVMSDICLVSLKQINVQMLSYYADRQTRLLIKSNYQTIPLCFKSDHSFTNHDHQRESIVSFRMAELIIRENKAYLHKLLTYEYRRSFYSHVLCKQIWIKLKTYLMACTVDNICRLERVIHIPVDILQEHSLLRHSLK